MPDSAGYLPPVVARIVGDISDLVAKLQQAKAMLRDFAKDSATVRIGADIAPALAEIQTLKEAIKSAGSDVKVGARPTAGTLAAGALGSLLGTGRSGGSLGALATGMLWGGTGGGFLSRLFSPLTMSSQMFSAGFGSAGSFAGFSPEHLAMTAGGLGGLGVEGAAGAGLLGLGSAGVSGAGMLADSAGTGQALGDIKNVLSAQKNLNQAIAEYGKNSTQAAHAQNLVNFALNGFSPVARTAVAQAAATATSFKAMYDKVTGQAEKIGAGIITQAITVGKAFLPELGKAATANAGIIQRGLQPLFTWLKSKGGGLGIFKNLETIFTARLPGAVKGFDAALELLLKTINLIAPQTGGLVKELSKLAEKANGSGWSSYAKHVEHLIADFRLLEKFFKALGHDLVGIFKDDAGEPQAIVGMWTTSLQKLGKWIDSVNGKKKIGQIFSIHKTEILDILHSIGMLSSAFGKIYMTVAPAFVGAVTRMLSVLNPFLQAVVKNPFGAWVVGLTIIGARFGLFKTLLGGVGKDIAALVGSLAKAALGMIGLGGATDAETVASTGAAAAAGILKAVLMVGILGAVIALAFGIYELVKHWKTVWTDIKKITSDVYHAVVGFFERMWHDVSGFASRIATDVAKFFTRMYDDVTGFAKRIWTDVVKWFKRMWSDITTGVATFASDEKKGWQRLYDDVVGFAKRIWTDVVKWFKRMWSDITTGVSRGVADVLSWFKSLPGKIISALGNVGSMLLDAGKSIITGLWDGMKRAWDDVTGWLGSLGHKIANLKGPPAKDAVLLTENGQLIMHGLGVGMKNGFLNEVTPLLKSMGGSIQSQISGAITPSTAGRSNPQLDRVETLLMQILSESKRTSLNTKATVDAARGLSSPSGVAAQIAQSHSKLVTSLRVGPAY